MKTKVFDFLAGALFVPVCAESGDDYDAIPAPRSRPFLVSQHERSAFLLRCVAR